MLAIAAAKGCVVWCAVDARTGGDDGVNHSVVALASHHGAQQVGIAGPCDVADTAVNNAFGIGKAGS